MEFSIDEKEFLENYAGWTVNVRPQLIKLLNQYYQMSKTRDEKEMFHVLAIEQFFLLYEQFEGFFRAIENRSRKPILTSLRKNLNIHNLYNHLSKISEDNLLEELRIREILESNELPQREKSEVKKRVLDIASIFKNERFYKAMSAILPIFKALKHKLLVYRKDNQTIFCLNKEEEKEIEKILEEKKIISNLPPKDLDYLEDMAERFKSAIQDLIAIRLYELK